MEHHRIIGSDGVCQAVLAAAEQRFAPRWFPAKHMFFSEILDVHNFLHVIDSPEAWGGAESHEEGGSWFR